MKKRLTTQVNHTTPHILVGICSARGYEARRKAQRESFLAQNVEGVTVFFFIGRGSSREEDYDFPDLVELDVPDDYKHLPEKVGAFFRYVCEKESFDWLFKCDDDTYLALDRLANLIREDADMIGDLSLSYRGAPSGGAGYFLRREWVERIIQTSGIPKTGYEDLIYGHLAQSLGARAHSTTRLCADSTQYPLPCNDQVSAHWCSPDKLRVLHALYQRSDYWEKEVCLHEGESYALHFYPHGIFRRPHDGKFGYWSWGKDGSLIFDEIHGQQDILYPTQDGYMNDEVKIKFTSSEFLQLQESSQHQDFLYPTQPTKKLIHLGCGGNQLPRWLNSDFPEIDIRQKLPFDSQSIDAYFLEHVIEHVSPAEAYHFFEEVWRTLKPRGILRLAFPDLLRIAKKTNASYLEFVHRCGWGNGLPGSEIRAIIVHHGHKAVWTKETLRITLESLGFEVSEYEPGFSHHRHLVGLEHHGDHISEEINFIETSCLEAVKFQ